MTIEVAVKTGSAVVFASDSKVTTRGLTGFDEEGNPQWLEQTYDNAIKVTYDRNQILMAMVAGDASIGNVTAADFISTLYFESADDIEGQDRKIELLIGNMVNEKRSYWGTTKIPEEKWPAQAVLLATSSPDRVIPRVWRSVLYRAESHTEEILARPGIWLEGAYDEVFALLYGYESSVLEGIAEQVGLPREFMYEVVNKILKPINKLNLWAMPVQDAIDLAVFLAEVQVEMDRFLPGTAACGGPIDVMVLQMTPDPGIRAYPGKMLGHPRHKG